MGWMPPNRPVICPFVVARPDKQPQRCAQQMHSASSGRARYTCERGTESLAGPPQTKEKALQRGRMGPLLSNNGLGSR
jgi:hypothetical protein